MATESNASSTVQNNGRKKNQVPEPLGLATTRLSDIRPVPITWLIPRYIPLGTLIVLAGDGGHGKSTLTLDMAACLTTGRPCFGLDYVPLSPSDVLLISCEDDFASTIVPRLLSAGADLSRVRRVDGTKTKDGEPTIFSLAHYQAMEHELEASPDVRLVVIDPAGAYIGRTGVDDNNDTQLRSLLGPMAELAMRRNVTVVLVKHLVKGARPRAVEKVGGSAGYVNAVRAAFVVAPDREDPNRKLFLPIKSNLGKLPSGLAFRMRSLDYQEQKKLLDDKFQHLDVADRTNMVQELFRMEWLGAVDADADDILSEQVRRDRGPNKVQRAAEWLARFLRECAYPSSEIVSAAEEAGFTLDNVQKAKTLLKERGLENSTIGRFQGEWWHGFGNPKQWKLRPASPETPDSPETTLTEEMETTLALENDPFLGIDGPETPDSPETSRTDEALPAVA